MFDFPGLQLNFSDSTLTHWGWDKMAAIFQTTFSNAFTWMKMCEFQLRFHWSLFLRVKLTTCEHWIWFRWWLGAVQVTSHYLNQWWFYYWRIYESLDLNELRQGTRMVILVVDTGWHSVASDWSSSFRVFSDKPGDESQTSRHYLDSVRFNAIE